jgi:hypothetical protein
MSSKCPVCTTDDVVEKPFGSAGVIEYLYVCERCGEFILKFPSADLPHMLHDDVEKRAVLSHWIRTKYEALQKQPPDKQGGRAKPYLSGELVNSITTNLRPSVAEQADNYVRWIGDNAKVGGRFAPVGRLSIQAIVGSANEQEFELVSHHLISDVKFIDHGPSDPRIWRAVTLSFDGWERYHELTRATSDSRRAFMAMEYKNEQLDDIFENVFRHAVARTGFDLLRLVDTPQPAGLIDDDLRVKIRASRFLIADLSDKNPGAYWEAGYAEGLGKPVIYTCEKTKFENSESRPHFDTNHHLTILWEWDSDKRKEAGEKLKSTIRATLPAEAKLEDE